MSFGLEIVEDKLFSRKRISQFSISNPIKRFSDLNLDTTECRAAWECSKDLSKAGR